MTEDIKTRLAEIQERYLYREGTYPDTVWLIDQLEQALAREERYREALTRLKDWAFVANLKLVDADNWPGGLAIKLAEEALQSCQGSNEKD